MSAEWAKLLIEGGFAAMCAVMLAILFWIIRKLLNDRNNHFATLGAQVRSLGTELELVKGMIKAVDMKADAVTTKLNSLPCDPHTDELRILMSDRAKQRR